VRAVRVVAPCQVTEIISAPTRMRWKNTHDEVFDDPEAGLVKIFTFIIATSPSTAFVPFAPTLRKWLIPFEVFERYPETYCTFVWYT
jgi:hypothetical protein